MRRQGRKPGPSEPALAKLRAALLAGPKAAGFATELWTVPRVRQLIVQRFRRQYSSGQRNGRCRIRAGGGDRDEFARAILGELQAVSHLAGRLGRAQPITRVLQDAQRGDDAEERVRGRRLGLERVRRQRRFMARQLDRDRIAGPQNGPGGDQTHQEKKQAAEEHSAPAHDDRLDQGAEVERDCRTDFLRLLQVMRESGELDASLPLIDEIRFWCR